MTSLRDLQVRQVTRLLGSFSELRGQKRPGPGWINTVRETLGMSIRQLAERTGMSKSAVASAEKYEEKGSVQLDTLRRLAEGLDCDLVYAIVPRDSLQETLRRQAMRKAEKLVNRVSDSMELEAQGVSDSERQRQTDEIADDILRNRGRDFWDV